LRGFAAGCHLRVGKGVFPPGPRLRGAAVSSVPAERGLPRGLGHVEGCDMGRQRLQDRKQCLVSTPRVQTRTYLQVRVC
jgi:hypothetical protein